MSGVATDGAAADPGVEHAGVGADPATPVRGAVEIVQGDGLAVARTLPDASFTLVYLDPPFNTGRTQERYGVSTRRAVVADGSASPDPTAGPGDDAFTTQAESTRDADSEAEKRGDPESSLSSERGAAAPVPAREPAREVNEGFHGHRYERVRELLHAYDDRFDDYGDFLVPRLEEAWRLLADDGTLYLHLDYREAHYAKVMLDAVFGRDSFLNEIIWAYDYGAKPRTRWPTKHDTILVYAKNPGSHVFNVDDIEREPYMAPGLVSAEKAARGKLPTDVWWHTIVPTTGREKTGYPTQKPEGILRRIVQASSRPGDRVLDLFAGSGTTGAVASALGRDALLVDVSPEAIRVMRERIPHASVRDA